MRRITEIFVHCSATRPDWMEGYDVTSKREEIRNWHVNGNGWSDIGYHKLIDRDGSVADGRPLERSGAHVRGHNKNSIGVCLIGGFGSASTDEFEDHFTPEQQVALGDLLDDLLEQFPHAKIRGHNEVAAKACPGFDAAAWWEHEQRKPLDFSNERTIKKLVAQQPKPPSPWRRFFSSLFG